MARTNASARRTGTAVAFVLMFLGSLTMVLPFLWMLSTSLKESRLVFTSPPQWIPSPVDWANYVEVWNIVPLASGLLNSAIVTTLVVVVGTFSSTMAAFAFAKLEFPYKRVLFVVLLSTIMVPLVVLIIPQFLLFVELGWIDTLLPLIVPGLLGNVTMIFFLRQYMLGLATELLEAAKLDGAGFFRIYWSIFLPLCKPAIAANVIIVFMATWNDYLGPLIFTHSPENATVQLVIASFSAYYAEQTDFPMIMTASIIAVLPVVVLFTAAQRYFVDSFAFSGIKG
ncbi:MAG: carbohydrate ABC transporter permease [Rhodoglobus sp.]|jgi:multiple sugar transport system permease protein|uniref:carbohydrate ABC transporter permease n=1 Tax=Microbacterium aurum TaxID=36805 RepID=UPI000DB1ECD0|nr:carbohydrate ABC transporter permease [Microbacterium aurum]MBZ6372272.1 carbohydrate ABC transporter permease [Microbacterium hominis]MDZ4044730.1 carbohydrate ABC transporter permease [Rhodoglobus sp.]PZU43567.1 MAG: sugar ABC transporter permease [Microbacterium sp.]